MFLYFALLAAYSLAASALRFASIHFSEPISAPRLREASFFTLFVASWCLCKVDIPSAASALRFVGSGTVMTFELMLALGSGRSRRTLDG